MDDLSGWCALLLAHVERTLTATAYDYALQRHRSVRTWASAVVLTEAEEIFKCACEDYDDAVVRLQTRVEVCTGFLLHEDPSGCFYLVPDTEQEDLRRARYQADPVELEADVADKLDRWEGYIDNNGIHNLVESKANALEYCGYRSKTPEEK